MRESHLVTYNQEELEAIERDLDVVRGVCFFNKPSNREHPIYLATAGAPGSRKSTILERFVEKHPEYAQSVYLDPDQRALRFMVHTYYNRSLSMLLSSQIEDYLEVRKAAYTKWRGASNYITLILLEEAFSQRMDVIHGSTSTGGHLQGFYEKLKGAGYHIVLLLCYCADEVRREAICHRNQVQFFFQSSADDDMAKGKFFPQKLPIYFANGDIVYLFWTDNLHNPEKLAAIYADGKMTVVDDKAYNCFVGKYEEDRLSLRQEGIEIPSWGELF